MKIIIFGTGKYYEKLKVYLVNNEIVALIDNDKTKQGKYIDGIKVFSPLYIKKFSYERIYILSIHFKEMKALLVDMGINPCKIYSLNTLMDFGVYLPYKIYNMNRRKKGKNVVVFSWNMTLSGAQIVLRYLIKILKNKGYIVTVASAEDGPLRDYFIDDGVTVVVDSNLLIATLDDIQWLNKPDLIIVNTVRLYYLLLKRRTDVPVFWWLHEPDFFYDYFDNEVLNKIEFDNIDVYAVSNIPKKAFQSYQPDIDVGLLPYGIPIEDVEDVDNDESISKIIFAIVGGWDCNKNQEMIFQLMQHINDSDRRRIEVWIIGKVDNKIYDQIENKYRMWDNIKFYGEKNRREINSLYNKINVLLILSKTDSLPVVACEAMQHRKVVLVSNGTGTAQFIEEKVNGLVFESGNVKELKKQILWLLSNKDKFKQIGNNGYQIFKENFSLEVFERNLMKVIEHLLI